MLSAIILVSAMAQFSNFDQLSLVREFPGKPGKNTFLQSHDFNPANATDCIGSIKASDVKFSAFGGKNPVRFFFSADREGDGVEELVVVRESVKTHQLKLSVYKTPFQLGKKAKLLVSSKQKDLGLFTGPGKIVAMGSIAVDDLPGDELAIISEAVNGARSLIIRKLPSKKNAKLGFPIRSDLTFGNVLTDEYMFLNGENLDDDPEEELVCLRRANGQPDQLLAFDAPTSLFAETGPPIRSDTNVDAVNGENIGIGFLVRAGLIHQGLVDKRFLAFYRKNAVGNVRVDCYNIPTGVATDLGPIIASDQSLDPAAQDIPEPIALTSIRKTHFKANGDYFDGEWRVEYVIQQTDPPLNPPQPYPIETIGPFGGTSTSSELTDTNGKLIFPFDQFNAAASANVTIPVEVTLSSFVTGAMATWEQFTPKLAFVLPSMPALASGLDASGFTVQFNHPPGTFTHTLTQMTIEKAGAVGAPIGELRDIKLTTPTHDIKIGNILSYRYVHDKPAN